MLHLLFALLIGAPPAEILSVSPTPQALHPLRLSAPAFGQSIEIEVRELPREGAREAIQAALAEVSAVEKLTDPEAAADAQGAGLAALNARAGQGPQPVDPRLLSALTRALEVCHWSERAHGPLGRDLYELWGLRTPAEAGPADDPEAFRRAVDAANCKNLRLNADTGTAELPAGAALDLWGFAEGLAVDQAVAVLRQHGVTNGFVQLGNVYRGFGSGLDSRGWHVQIQSLPGMALPLGRIFLRDQSLAVASATDRPLRVAVGAGLPPYVHQREGRPAKGTLATCVVTTSALDAQALAVTLAITGPNEGQLRLGTLRPRPSVLWLQGSGGGEPLTIEYQWGLVPKR